LMICRLARVTLAAIAIWPAVLAAQSGRSDDRPTWWGTLALGAGGARDSGFYHATIGAAYQVRHLLVMGRVSSISTPDYNRMEDAGILVGLATRPSDVHLSAAWGLSAAHDNRGNRTLAFPIEAQATWRFLPWAGLGVRVFGVPNSLTNYGGISA